MLRVMIVILKVIAAVLAIPLLLLATCTYTSFSPHLRFDPLLRTLMDAPDLSETDWWRTKDVALIPTFFAAGETRVVVEARLADSDFSLVATDEAFPGEQYFSDRGITHLYERRGGRVSPACGETFELELGFVEERLQRATGYSRWTCL